MITAVSCAFMNLLLMNFKIFEYVDARIDHMVKLSSHELVDSSMLIQNARIDHMGYGVILARMHLDLVR